MRLRAIVAPCGCMCPATSMRENHEKERARGGKKRATRESSPPSVILFTLCSETTGAIRRAAHVNALPRTRQAASWHSDRSIRSACIRFNFLFPRSFFFFFFFSNTTRLCSAFKSKKRKKTRGKILRIAFRD